ncbi:NLR family CARD domain-containing protein 3-like [Garra rufa]|uniref:NLR family CARD domain-containing protein 3-like n=1 Tax=Garra rufa TaxID=137080 RepID=UPI003CCE95C1
MYTHFLILQTNIKHEKDYEKKVTDEDMILKLGKVAFEQLVKGNLIFYEEDLRECGIDVTEASVYSGLCTQIFREEFGFYQGKVFCFVHPSIQEHLAALYVHLSWTNHNRNVFESITKQSLPSKLIKPFQLSSSEHVSLSELHQRAIDEALQSKNGHLDLFLRFLLGLSVDFIMDDTQTPRDEDVSPGCRRAATEDTAIKCNHIFRPLPEQDKAIRTVLTKGVAGIGKTVSVQKFILDWAEGKENQDVQLIFPLPFREINLMKDKTLSLSDLLHVFFPETKEIEISSDEYKVLFIFDGLDECRLSLNFKSKVKLCNISESASVDVLLMNLIVGNLLPSALIWITSRPAAADLIPSECVHRVTEVRGFNEPQKEEYFRKRISDQSLANRIISHLKSSRSLYIMCHIPVFCWISAAVLEKMLSPAESGEIPKTLTQMYTHFLILQTNIKREKDYEKNVTDEDMILKLGKLAFQQLVKGNLIFYEKDLRECGIDVTEASVYSGLCTQIFREEFGLYQGKVFCFVHLSIQEHLAALHVHLSWTNHNRNVFEQITKQRFQSKMKKYFQLSSSEHVSLSELHQRAIDEALQSKNGHLDLFLRFLLGLSVESHQILLQRIMKMKRSSSDSNEKTVEFIKMKIRTIDSPEKSINLFHCLNELGDHSLVEEIQRYLQSGTIKEANLSSSQWSAVVFVLLTSKEELNVFRLDKFVKVNNETENMNVLQKLLPVIKESRSVHCGEEKWAGETPNTSLVIHGTRFS